MLILLMLALLAGDDEFADDELDPNAPLPLDMIHNIIVGNHLELARVRSILTSGEDWVPATGRCFGNQRVVGRFFPAADLRKVLAGMVTGPAFQCYLSSYFGCTIGDRVARAGVARKGPAYGPWNGSDVVIVEQTATRVVADVTEIESRLISPGGALNMDFDPHLEKPPLVEKTSRYTLIKDDKGRWLVYDRKPNFPWECRVR